MTLHDSLHSIGINLPPDSLDQIVRDGVRDALAHPDILARIASAELDRRRSRSFKKRLGKSHLGHAALIADFDLNHPTRLDRALLDEAFSLRFIADGGAVLLVGAPGLGKTHIAKALVHAAIAAGHRALFVDSMRALDDLVTARQSGRLRTRLRHYLRPHLLCLDAVAYQRIDIELVNS